METQIIRTSQKLRMNFYNSVTKRLIKFLNCVVLTKL